MEKSIDGTGSDISRDLPVNRNFIYRTVTFPHQWLPIVTTGCYIAGESKFNPLTEKDLFNGIFLAVSHRWLSTHSGI